MSKWYRATLTARQAAKLSGSDASMLVDSVTQVLKRSSLPKTQEHPENEKMIVSVSVSEQTHVQLLPHHIEILPWRNEITPVGALVQVDGIAGVNGKGNLDENEDKEDGLELGASACTFNSDQEVRRLVEEGALKDVRVVVVCRNEMDQLAVLRVR